MNRRRLIIYISAFVILIIIFVSIYLYFRYRSDISEEVVEEFSPAPELIISENKFADFPEFDFDSKIETDYTDLIFNSMVFDFGISDIQDEVYYFNLPDEFYRYNLLTNTKTLLAKKNFDPDKVYKNNRYSWSPDFRKIGIFYDEKDEPKRLIFNVNDLSVDPLNRNIVSMDWSADGNNIIYLYYDPVVTYTLNIADSDGSNWYNLNIASLSDYIKFEKDNLLSWSPDGSKVAIYSNGEFELENTAEYDEIIIVDVYTKQLMQISRDNASVTNAVWSPQGDKLIYEVLDENLISMLWMYDFKSGQETNLDTYSYVNRMDFIDNSNIITAVPDVAGSIYSLYLEEFDNSAYKEKDEELLTFALQKINLDSSQKEILSQITDDGEPVYVRDLFYNPTTENIYIIGLINYYRTLLPKN